MASLINFENYQITTFIIVMMLSLWCWWAMTVIVYCDDDDGVKYDPNNWPNLCPVSKSCAWKLLWLFTGRGQAAICRSGAWTKLWKGELHFAGLDIVDNQIFHVCSRIQRIELVRHREFPLTSETEKLVGHKVSSRLFWQCTTTQ